MVAGLHIVATFADAYNVGYMYISATIASCVSRTHRLKLAQLEQSTGGYGDIVQSTAWC